MRKEPSLRHYAVVNMPLDLLEMLIEENYLNIFLNKFLEFVSIRERNWSNKPARYIISVSYETLSADLLFTIFCKYD